MRVRLRYSDWADEEQSLSFPPTAYDQDLQPLARKLLWKLYARRVTVRFLGVQFSNFQVDEGQLELFTDQTLERFTRAVDAIRDKFGHGAIVAGRAIELLNKLPKDAYGYVLRTPSLTK
jgi:DNA polymerase-4